MDGYTFGYRVGYLADGRVELTDPPAPLTAATIMFLVIPGIFIFVGILAALRAVGVALPSSGLISIDSRGMAPWLMAGMSLFFGLLGFSFGAQVFVQRCWFIDSSTFTRRISVRGLPFSWQSSYRLQAIEILHEVWQDEEGISDSVKGVVADRHDKSITFDYFDVPTRGPVHGRTGGWLHPKAAHKPKHSPRLPSSEGQQMPIEGEVTPRVWWLGHWLAEASHLPLRFQTRVRKAPDLSGD